MLKKLILGFLVSLLVAACAVSPTGRQQFIVVSSEQLTAMGAAAFRDLQRTKGVTSNPRTNAYVRCVANAIVSEVQGGPARWEVKVFEDPSVNAFALPGGKIGVFTGLLEVAKNQDQLAAVIGHEVGHVLARHANERVSQEMAVQGGLAVIGSVAGDGSGLSPQVMQALGLGAQVGILLPFSRVHESEADIIGLDLMARAGFDPRASVSLWQNMSRTSGGQPPEFLSTHPSHSTRIQDLQAAMPTAIQTFEASRARGKQPQCHRSV